MMQTSVSMANDQPNVLLVAAEERANTNVSVPAAQNVAVAQCASTIVNEHTANSALIHKKL